MKKSDSDSMRDDFISNWIKESGDIKAPEGFTHNVMTRVNLEHGAAGSRSRSPFGLPFRIGSAVVFAILLIVSILSPQAESGSWLHKYIEMLPDFGRYRFSIPAPDLSFLAGYHFLVYILIASTILLLLDAIFIRRVLLREK